MTAFSLTSQFIKWPIDFSLGENLEGPFQTHVCTYIPKPQNKGVFFILKYQIFCSLC